MRKDIIPINKDMIPYKFEINLTDVPYILEVRYNSTADLFTIGLYDRDDNLICTEPIIYGAELFVSQYQPEIYPTIKIVPQDESNETSVVTHENFNETVYLVIENEGDEIE